MKKEKIFLGELLINNKLITHEDLEKALVYIKETGFRLGHALIQLGIMNDDELAKILSEQTSQNCIAVKKVDVSKEVLDKLSYEFCINNKCIPIELVNDEIIMAVVDPYDINLIDDLRFLAGMEIRPQFATEYSIFKAIEKTFKSKSIKHTLKTKKSDSHIINLVNQILFDAIEKGASDIHIENFESKVNLRHRIDGELLFEKEPDKKGKEGEATGEEQVMSLTPDPLPLFYALLAGTILVLLLLYYFYV